MSYIETHPLLRPIIREDNRQFRQQARRQGKSAELADAVAEYKRKGGEITWLPYMGDISFDDT